jgi:peroxiredoxin-like protein
MPEAHRFEGNLRWTGAAVEAGGPGGRLMLQRAFTLEFAGKPALEGSSPALFGGDDGRHNPETLMVASLMACHLLTYLAVCERSGVRIAEYSDRAAGRLAIKDGKMRMVEVVLKPRVKVADATQIDRASALHEKAHANCFMSNSVNFEVKIEPVVTA